MKIEKNISLKPYNTFGLDVQTAFLVRIKSLADVKYLYQSEQFNALPKMILGGGSNVLFTSDYQGLMVKNEILGLNIQKEDEEHVVVSAGAGESWHRLVMWTIDNGWGGLENLSLIPGTVGAAPMQNIGAYGVEIKDVFDSLEAYNKGTGQLEKFTKKDCDFGYRYSVFKGALKNQFVITNVSFKLNKKPNFKLTYGNLNEKVEELGGGDVNLKVVSDAVIEIRQSKLPDPKVTGNAGSFFKNPVIDEQHFKLLANQFHDIKGFKQLDGVKVPAGWLIEHAGWKGYRKRDFGVHDKQALVLVNHGNAKGEELLGLSEQIITSINAKYNIKLEREVNIVA